MHVSRDDDERQPGLAPVLVETLHGLRPRIAARSVELLVTRRRRDGRVDANPSNGALSDVRESSAKQPRHRPNASPGDPSPSPAWVRRHLIRWSDKNLRRYPWRKSAKSHYELIVTEILLQRTRAETVARFHAGFFRRFPTWASLARARERELRHFLKPIGLWRRRAQALVSLARAVTALHERIPQDRETLEHLPGVGQYVANAVRLLCHGKPEPLLDSNMARVLERVFGPRKLADIRYDPYLQRLSRRVVAGRVPRVINWAILDLGALICTPRSPRCAVCPLNQRCRFARQLIPLAEGDEESPQPMEEK